MKKTFLMIAFIATICAQKTYAIDMPSGISAQTAVVYDASSGRILWGKESDRQMLIASTTKIMTALVAIEHCDMHEEVLITEQMSNVEGSSMYLRTGETYTVQELLYGLMLASGNDAATALALYISGDVSEFAVMMNEKAAELGLENTSFENPHGLDGTEHYSTAEDMAVLASYAMNVPRFAEIVGTRHISVKDVVYVNHNKLLWQYEGITGIKTGYTKAAGRTLVSSCEKNSRRLICVTLSAPDDWNDHKAIYNWAYGTYEERVLLEKQEKFSVPIMDGSGCVIWAVPETDVTAFLREDETADYVVELPRFVFGSVEQGERAGQIVVFADGNVVNKVPLVYSDSHEISEVKR